GDAGTHPTGSTSHTRVCGPPAAGELFVVADIDAPVIHQAAGHRVRDASELLRLVLSVLELVIDLVCLIVELPQAGLELLSRPDSSRPGAPGQVFILAQVEQPIHSGQPARIAI